MYGDGRRKEKSTIAATLIRVCGQVFRREMLFIVVLNLSVDEGSLLGLLDFF